MLHLFVFLANINNYLGVLKIKEFATNSRIDTS